MRIPTFVISTVAAAALLCLGSARLSAGELARPTRQPAEDAETAFARLGPTPSEGAVLALASKAEFAEAMPAYRLAGVLTVHGGYACAQGLRMLVWHRAPEVRAAALRGLSQVRVRIRAEDMDSVRDALGDDDTEVREAAFAALGAIGDGTDVPRFLDALASKDEATVTRAFGALRDLSGARLRCRVAIWRHWWKEAQDDGAKRLAGAFDAIESAEGADAAAARLVIDRSAWIRLSDVRERLRVWLASPRPELRREAYRLTAQLRLGDLAGRLVNALSWETEVDNVRAGVEAAKVLGVAAPELSPAVR